MQVTHRLHCPQRRGEDFVESVYLLAGQEFWVDQLCGLVLLGCGARVPRDTKKSFYFVLTSHSVRSRDSNNFPAFYNLEGNISDEDNIFVVRYKTFLGNPRFSRYNFQGRDSDFVLFYISIFSPLLHHYNSAVFCFGSES